MEESTEKPNKWNRIKDNLDVLSLFIVTLASILSIFWGPEIKMEDRIYTLLTATVLTLIIDRFKHVYNLKKEISETHTRVKKLDDIEKQFSNHDMNINSILKNINLMRNKADGVHDIEFIEGSNIISMNYNEYVQFAQSEIRATSFSVYNHYDMCGMEYNNVLASTIKKKLDETGNKIKYRTAYIKGQNLENRIETFKKHGIYDPKMFLEIENPLKVNFLIIDDSYLFIAFFTSDVDTNAKICILIKNNKEFIRSIGDWYDHYIWNANIKIN